MMVVASVLVAPLGLSGPPLPGTRIEPFTMPVVGEGLREWRPGAPTVVTVCAFWCDTWKVQLPRVAEARQAFGPMGVAFVTVSIDGRFSERAPVDARPVWEDRGSRWSDSLEIRQVPFTLVIDRAGVVRWAAAGTLQRETLFAGIRKAVEPPTDSVGAVYLAFDDYPAKRLNDELLDALRSLEVPATLFCIGQNAQLWPDAVRRAAREGHSIQTHGWTHDAAKPQTPRCVAFLEGLTGETPTLYRPPGSQKVFAAGGRPLTLPAVDPYDYRRPGREELIWRVLQQVRPGCIVQLHAGVQETLDTLPELVRRIRARGFNFEALR